MISVLGFSILHFPVFFPIFFLNIFSLFMNRCNCSEFMRIKKNRITEQPRQIQFPKKINNSENKNFLSGLLEFMKSYFYPSFVSLHRRYWFFRSFPLSFVWIYTAIHIKNSEVRTNASIYIEEKKNNNWRQFSILIFTLPVYALIMSGDRERGREKKCSLQWFAVLQISKPAECNEQFDLMRW